MENACANPQTYPPSDAPSPGAVRAAFKGAPHRRLTIGKHRLAYRAFGRGPDLVFVHGWPLHAATFRALVPLLGDRFTCHLIDLPGAGQTQSERGADIGFEAQAATMRAAVDALGLRRYALVAHDSGGLIARLIAQHDTRVVALVSGDTEVPGHTPGVIKRLAAVASVPGGVDLVRLVMHMRAVRRSRLGFRGCFDDIDFIDGEFHELFMAPLLASKEAWGRQFDVLRTIDFEMVDRLPEVHARITAPVQLIWGTDDPLFPIELARRMLAQFPFGATLHEIARGRTFVHEEQPAAFAAHAKPFLVAAFEGEARAPRSRPMATI